MVSSQETALFFRIYGEEGVSMGPLFKFNAFGLGDKN